MNAQLENAKRYSRGYVPHWNKDSLSQMLTIRLVDSFPRECLAKWQEEFALLSRVNADMKTRFRIEEYLDKGRGSVWLSRSDVAEVVQNALLHFDGSRYRLHAWVVMPNHVHVLVEPFAAYSIAQIVHSWKSYTASAANKLIGREGAFWQREYYDRFVRSEEHYWAVIRYIEHNPVKAGLCLEPGDWAYSSASRCMAGVEAAWKAALPG